MCGHRCVYLLVIGSNFNVVHPSRFLQSELSVSAPATAVERNSHSVNSIFALCPRCPSHLLLLNLLPVTAWWSAKRTHDCSLWTWPGLYKAAGRGAVIDGLSSWLCVCRSAGGEGALEELLERTMWVEARGSLRAECPGLLAWKDCRRKKAWWKVRQRAGAGSGLVGGTLQAEDEIRNESFMCHRRRLVRYWHRFVEPVGHKWMRAKDQERERDDNQSGWKK